MVSEDTEFVGFDQDAIESAGFDQDATESTGLDQSMLLVMRVKLWAIHSFCLHV